MATTIEDYLNLVKSCDNQAILQNNLEVYDNWMVLLYGKSDYQKIIQLFLESSGRLSDSWKKLKESKDGNEFWLVNCKDSLYVQIVNDRYHLYEDENDKIRGNLHSAYFMLHPRYISKQEDMKPTVINLIETLISEDYQFRLPMSKLRISYFSK